MDITSFLQSKGISRRAIIRLLQNGGIQKNGEIISYRKELLTTGDEIKIDGYEDNFIVDSIKDTYTIILFNKPRGLVVSKEDEHNETIYTIAPVERKNKYYYIGRLDKDSHGLLILTDASKLVSFFSHPRYSHEKVYNIITDRPILEEDILKGKEGVYYYDNDQGQDILLHWDSCKNIGENRYEIRISEGKKRHIRRLCDALGYNVYDLSRIQFGPWKLDGLKDGDRKEISISSGDVENLLANQNSYKQKQI